MSSLFNPELVELNLTPHPVLQWTQQKSREFFHWILTRRCTITFHGQEHVHDLRQCIFAPTHASHLDFWAVLEGLEETLVRRTYIAAAADYFYRPFIKRWITKLVSFHNFPINRTRVSLQDYHTMQTMLVRGLSLLAFAQGTRARDGKPKPMKPMLSMLSIDQQVPIVPVVIRGTFEALPAGRFWPKAHPVHVYYGKPIVPPAAKTRGHSQQLAKLAKALNREVMQKIEELYAAVDPNPEKPLKK